MRNFLSVVIIAFVFSACSFKEVEKTPQSYRLENQKASTVFSSQDKRVILVQNIGGDSVALSKSIIYNEKGALRPYKYSRWSELPAIRLQQLIIQSFEKRHLFQAAIPNISLAKSDLVLESELSQFEQVFEGQKSYVQMQLDVRVIEKKDLKILGVKSLHVKIPVEGTTTHDTIESFNKATSEVITQLGDWIKGIL